MRKEIQVHLDDILLKYFVGRLEDIFINCDINIDFIRQNNGTLGWSNAFRDTCHNLNKTILIEYYESLDWEDCDEFCFDLGELIIEKGIIKGG